MDLIMATVLFIAIFGAFYGFITYIIVEPEEKMLAREGQQVVTSLSAKESTTQIIEAEELDIQKIEELVKQDYPQLKGQLGLKNDFCIYIEDEDGKLVKMGANTSIGNAKATLTLGNKEISCGGTG